jgi:hypothetical protein
MKKLICFSVIFLQYILSYSQNPIVPPSIYIADPSAHVWKDGKLYVYGSRDESPEYYCSWSHHVLSTSDLKTWTNISIAVPSVTGVHALWLRFSTKGSQSFKVDWFRFE